MDIKELIKKYNDADIFFNKKKKMMHLLDNIESMLGKSISEINKFILFSDINIPYSINNELLIKEIDKDFLYKYYKICSKLLDIDYSNKCMDEIYKNKLFEYLNKNNENVHNMMNSYTSITVKIKETYISYVYNKKVIDNDGTIILNNKPVPNGPSISVYGKLLKDKSKNNSYKAYVEEQKFVDNLSKLIDFLDGLNRKIEKKKSKFSFKYFEEGIKGIKTLYENLYDNISQTFNKDEYSDIYNNFIMILPSIEREILNLENLILNSKNNIRAAYKQKKEIRRVLEKNKLEVIKIKKIIDNNLSWFNIKNNFLIVINIIIAVIGCVITYKASIFLFYGSLMIFIKHILSQINLN